MRWLKTVALFMLGVFIYDVSSRAVKQRRQHLRDEMAYQHRMDTADTSDLPEVEMTPVGFGDLAVVCPKCETAAHGVLVGLITDTASEDEEDEETTPEMQTAGIIAYPCGDVFFSTCFTDKVGTILNAEEEHTLRPSMFANLISCDEHDIGPFPGQG